MADAISESGHGFVIDNSGVRTEVLYQMQVRTVSGIKSASISVPTDHPEIRKLFMPPQGELSFELKSGAKMRVIPSKITNSIGVLESTGPIPGY